MADDWAYALYDYALYLSFFDEITDTKNQITQAKLDHSEAVATSKTAISTFPELL
ncbi:MAG: hypothetical protein ACFFAY_04425 [Promethearchaeota archaeon]